MALQAKKPIPKAQYKKKLRRFLIGEAILVTVLILSGIYVLACSLEGETGRFFYNLQYLPIIEYPFVFLSWIYIPLLPLTILHTISTICFAIRHTYKAYYFTSIILCLLVVPPLLLIAYQDSKSTGMFAGMGASIIGMWILPAIAVLIALSFILYFRSKKKPIGKSKQYSKKALDPSYFKSLFRMYCIRAGVLLLFIMLGDSVKYLESYADDQNHFLSMIPNEVFSIIYSVVLILLLTFFIKIIALVIFWIRRSLKSYFLLQSVAFGLLLVLAIIRTRNLIVDTDISFTFPTSQASFTSWLSFLLSFLSRWDIYGRIVFFTLLLVYTLHCWRRELKYYNDFLYGDD